MPYPCIPLDIKVLLLEPQHAEDHIIVGDIGDDKVDFVAPLCSSAILHVKQLAYNGSSAQGLANDCGDKWWLSFPCCLKADMIHYNLGSIVVSGALVNKRRLGVVTLATRALLQIYQDLELQWQRFFIGILFI